jgi:DNA polymerase-1
MIKLAMVKVHQAFKEHGFQSKMILQVHDELVFDVIKEEAEKIQPVIIDCMQSAMTLPNNVPVVAEVGAGANWLEAH